jgi:hypothetical protein
VPRQYDSTVRKRKTKKEYTSFRHFEPAKAKITRKMIIFEKMRKEKNRKTSVGFIASPTSSASLKLLPKPQTSFFDNELWGREKRKRNARPHSLRNALDRRFHFMLRRRALRERMLLYGSASNLTPSSTEHALALDDNVALVRAFGTARLCAAFCRYSEEMC